MKFWKSYTWALLAVGLAMAAPRFAAGDDDVRTAFDKRFVKEASEWAMAMNDISRLAKTNSNSDGVHHYADVLIDGQEKLLDELHTIAARHDYHLADEMTEHQRETKRRLEHLHDTDFDVEYMSEQRVDQQSMVDLFEEARKECLDDNLRSFADRKLPAIKEYRDSAEDMYRKVKDKKRD
jgi:predicted outer membrane protein